MKLWGTEKHRRPKNRVPGTETSKSSKGTTVPTNGLPWGDPRMFQGVQPQNVAQRRPKNDDTKRRLKGLATSRKTRKGNEVH